MAFGILSKQFSGAIEMGVLANAGEHIHDLASVRFGVLHPISSEERQVIMPREIDQRRIRLCVVAQKMPLQFDENIFVSKSVDQKLSAIRGILGSEGVPSVGFGVSPKRSSRR